jgi:hypothetical protein
MKKTDRLYRDRSRKKRDIENERKRLIAKKQTDDKETEADRSDTSGMKEKDRWIKKQKNTEHIHDNKRNRQMIKRQK